MTTARQLVQGETRDGEQAIAQRYRVERLLDRGGMGAVYLVVDEATGRRCALKRLLKAAGPRATELFEREYTTLAGLRHASIIEVYEYGVTEEGPFYTMELLEGADLSRMAPMPWREVCRCLRDVASMLGVLHARRVVYRDLTPRNLWLTPEGQVKMLDFGALAPFGRTGEVVGTPPFIAPEALDSHELDQRSDLFSLGAVAYWLLTGAHAFPASSLGELHRLWQQEPANVASLVRMRKDAPALPSELEELVHALLSIDPRARPESAIALIERLNLIAGLESEVHEVATRAYLESKTLVGRGREREQFTDMLARAGSGKAQVLVFEGPEGIGRTRLLEQLVVSARLAGAVVVRVDKSSGALAFGAAGALARTLLSTLPETARRCAAPYLEELAHLAPDIAVALGEHNHRARAADPREARLNLQTALADWISRVAEEQLLAIFVDDLHALDEESQAVLMKLAQVETEQRLVLAASVLAQTDTKLSPAAKKLRELGSRMLLAPLTEPETCELLESVFGATHYLDRLSERLYAISAGNPAHCLELAQHLVRDHAVRYVDGMWVLPTELDESRLPTTRGARLLERIKTLTPEERTLAQLLSVPHDGALTQAMCNAAGGAELAERIPALVQAGVLREAADGFRFAHEQLREALCAELGEDERVSVHLRLGRCIEEGAEDREVELVRASLHFLYAGDVQHGRVLLTRGGRLVMDDFSMDALRSIAPMLEDVVKLLKAQGADARALVFPVALLAIAGYFVHRRYALKYGEQAAALLTTVLRFDVLRWLSRYIGGLLALMVTLLIVRFSLRKQKETAPTAIETIRLLATASATLTGTSAICIDPARGRRFTELLEPLRVLGEDHAISITYRYNLAMAQTGEDDQAIIERNLSSMIVRLESPLPIREMAPELRREYLAGAKYGRGMRACLREGEEGLRTATELENVSPLHAMYAESLRALYYSYRGDPEQATKHQQRVETLAIQLGSAWQVENTSPFLFMLFAAATNDLVLLKRCNHDLTRLSQELPSIANVERMGRAAYLLTLRKYHEVIALLEAQPSSSCVGTASAQGRLAAAYNGLGQHERALSICRAALAGLSPENQSYTAINLNLEIELAYSYLGIGQIEEARRVLDELLVMHADKGPITLGSLHRAQARVAIAAEDLVGAQEHCARASEFYYGTRMPSLIVLAEKLRREVHLAGHPQRDSEDGALRVDDVHLTTRVRLLMETIEKVPSAAAERGLSIAIELAMATSGFIVFPGGDIVHHGAEAPDSELARWAEDRLEAAVLDDKTAVEDADSVEDMNVTTSGSKCYCITPLWIMRDGETVAVAALALGFEGREPQVPSTDVLCIIASHLTET